MASVLAFLILWIISFLGGTALVASVLHRLGVNLGDHGDLAFILFMLVGSAVGSFRVTRWLRRRGNAPPEPWPEPDPPFPGDEERDALIAARIGRVTTRCTIAGAGLGILMAGALAIHGNGADRSVKLRPLLMAPFALGGAGMFLGLSVSCLFAPESFLTGPVGRPYLEKIGTRNVTTARLVCLGVAVIIGGPLLAVAALFLLAQGP